MLEGVRRVVALVRDDLCGDEVLRLGRAIILGPAIDLFAQLVLPDSHACPEIKERTHDAGWAELSWTKLRLF